MIGQRLFPRSLALLFGMALVIQVVLADTKAPPKPKKKGRASLPEITYANVKYGPHKRNVLDFWQGKGDGPHPLLVIIHGGGWLGGSKEKFTKQYSWLIPELLEKGVSVVSINYRLLGDAPLPAPVYDAVRAIQFLRYNAKKYDIDKEKIICTGNSAGATTSLWIATHDDIADPSSDDPVLRESSRISAAWASSGQTSIDPMVLKTWKNASAIGHPMIRRSGGFNTNEEMMKDYKKSEKIYHEFSPINHLSKDDPPIYLRYGGTPDDTKNGIHHINYGIQFKNKADKIGVVCHMSTQKNVKLFPTPPDIKDFLYGVWGIKAKGESQVKSSR